MSILRCHRLQNIIKRFSHENKDPLDLTRIRNIGISAHIDSGKTTLSERILFYSNRIKTMHEVRGKDGVGAVMDHMELERQRGITIQSASTYTFWRQNTINLIDTPGHIDFTVEVERALRVLDGGILVLCAVGGVQSQTMTVTRQMNRYDIPRIAFINKLDRLGSNPNRVISQIRKKLNKTCAFINIPIGLENANTGIIDIINERALYFEEPNGLVMRSDSIPSEYMAEFKERRHELILTLADMDDHLSDLYLEEKPISSEDISNAIKRQTIHRKFMPVMVGTALKNKGVQPLLDAIVDYLPNPGEVQHYALSMNENKEKQVLLSSARDDKKPFLGLAFKLEASKFGQLTYIRVYQGKLSKGDTLVNVRTKTKVKISRLGRVNVTNLEDLDCVYAGDIAALFGIDCASGDTFMPEKCDEYYTMESMYIPEPVVSMTIQPVNKSSAENFNKGMRRFTREDPTFKWSYDEENEQSLVSGMGELHLEIYAQRLEKEYNAPCVLGKPKVAFKETIKCPVEFDYLHKKQSGGAGQYGRVIGVVEPLPYPDNTLIKFIDETSGTNIPKNFVSSIETGFRKRAEKGGRLAGQKISGLLIRLQDGAHHSVDSSDYSFQLAAEGALNQIMDLGDWQVIEPVMKVEVSAPVEFQSQVMTSLTKRNGIINDSESEETYVTIIAEVPLNNMFGFIGELRGITEGKGEFTMEFSRYNPANSDTGNRLIDEFNKQEDDRVGVVKKKKKK